jgi:hypothetical protein
MFEYSWDEFIELYPKFKNKANNGRLPIDDDEQSKQDTLTYDDEQRRNMEERKVQVLHWFNKNLDGGTYVVFAGKDATIVEKKVGKEYPFRDKKGNPDIPVYQFMCFPGVKATYNEGLGSLLYRLHIQTKQLMNMAISATRDRVDPVYFMYTAKKDRELLENKILKAMQDKMQGGMGVVSLQRDENGNQTATKIESLIGEIMTQEFERIFAQYDLLIKRIGINIDDIPQTVDTVGQAQLAEAGANAFVQQIMEVNGDEFKRIYEGMLTDIRDHVSENDDTPIRSDRPPVKTEDGTVKFGTATLGGISQLLNTKGVTFEVKVAARSGAYPDILAERERNTEVMNALSAIAPGSPAHLRSMAKFANLRNEAVTEDDFAVPQQALPPQQ